MYNIQDFRHNVLEINARVTSYPITENIILDWPFEFNKLLISSLTPFLFNKLLISGLTPLLFNKPFISGLSPFSIPLLFFLYLRLTHSLIMIEQVRSVKFYLSLIHPSLSIFLPIISALFLFLYIYPYPLSMLLLLTLSISVSHPKNYICLEDEPL